MKHVKSLASQTAVYGVSSILGRVLNYLLVPLHTSLFLPDSLGIRDYLYVVSALLLIVYTHGMETTYFRFSTKNENGERSAFNTTLTSVVIISLIATILLWVNSGSIATVAQFPDYPHLIRWLAIILFIDSVTAIPFARLRLQNKARLFATLKILSIALNIGLQVLFLIILPEFVSNSSYFSTPLIDHIFLANLIANLIILLFFTTSLLQWRPAFNWSNFKPYFIYSLPLLLTGVAGWVVEQADKFLVRELMTTEDLGVYAQTFKLAIFMQLAVQAFRYAGEPFFFNSAEEEDAPEKFADILYYFSLFSLLVLVGISANIEIVGQIFLRNPAYRVALYLVPILLAGKYFYGLYVNISIWFKLKDKTIFGTYFTIVGAVITLVGNFILIPKIGYLGAAITTVVAYFFMTALCYGYGRKYFPVPYPVLPILLHLGFACLVILVALNVKLESIALTQILRAIISLIYLGIILLLERKRWKLKST